jgi:glycosyltransferase involved in cell wall biosynthesis
MTRHRIGERHVLVPIHAPSWGGVHALQEALGRPLAERGWPLLVALPEADPDSAQRLSTAGVETLPLPLSRFRRSGNPAEHLRSIAGLLRDIRRLQEVIRRRDVAVVKVCGLHNIHGAIAARRSRRPLVWQLLSAMVPAPIRRAAMPFILRSADVVMTNGGGAAIRAAFPGLPTIGDRWTPFFNPVDTTRFRPDPDRRAEARRRLGFAPDDIVVGTVGNRTVQKAHDVFVEAAALARDLDRRLRFCIVGAPVESNAGWYQRDVVGKARGLGLFDKPDLVIVDGGRAVADLLPAFDIFAMTSRSEGIPMAMIEAMATGLPTVVPDIGGMAETSPDGQTGLVLGAPEGGAYAAAWAALAADEARRHNLGRAAQDLASRQYSVDAVASVYADALERAVARPRGPSPGGAGGR